VSHQKFSPASLVQIPEPFDHPDWIFEIKYDGFRALAYFERGSVRLVSRKDNVYKSFAELCAGMAESTEVESAVLDGEVVCLGQDGRPLFCNLMRRQSPQYFYAFDVLQLAGRDVRSLPLLERKRILRRIIPLQPAPILYADFIPAKGVDLFRAICDRDMEGIVAN
jgi:bifunctional non-homologous end joining protein LigD